MRGRRGRVDEAEEVEEQERVAEERAKQPAPGNSPRPRKN